MDILLIDTSNGTRVTPKSIHGILWLQTHFETNHWDSLASNQVILPKEDAKILLQDAKEAGIQLNCLPSLSITSKF